MKKGQCLKKNILLVAVELNSSKQLAPNFRINTKNFTYVDETSLMSHPNIIKFDSKNKIYYETLNKYFTNFEEELEIENHEQDDTSTSLATDLPLTK